MGRFLFQHAPRLVLLVLTLHSASVANALVCPKFQCGEGVFTLGKFLDPNTPSDVFLEPSDPLVEAYFFPGQMYNYNQYNIFDEMLSDPHTDCYRFCAGYNSKLPADAKVDVKAKYWMFEETCVDGNGGICACYNGYRCKDENSYTNDWMQPARGDVATDDYEVPANFTVGELCIALQKGDPHFTGADGSHFDFSGLPNHHFALISDAHFQVNGYFGGRFGTWGNTTKALTWIRSLGIMHGHQTAVLEARNGSAADYLNGYLGRVTVNDRPVRVPAPGTSVTLWPGASLHWKDARLRSGNDLVDVYDLLIAGMGTLRFTLRPEVKNLRTGDDGVVHFGIDVLGSSFSSAVHGVLGQTYRPDFHGRLATQKLKYNHLLRTHVVPGDNAEGFIDGTVEDYLVSGLLKSDCRFCRFSRSPEVDGEMAHALALLRSALPKRFFPQPWFGRKGKGKRRGKGKGKKWGRGGKKGSGNAGRSGIKSGVKMILGGGKQKVVDRGEKALNGAGGGSGKGRKGGSVKKGGSVQKGGSMKSKIAKLLHRKAAAAAGGAAES